MQEQQPFELAPAIAVDQEPEEHPVFTDTIVLKPKKIRENQENPRNPRNPPGSPTTD